VFIGGSDPMEVLARIAEETDVGTAVVAAAGSDCET